MDSSSLRSPPKTPVLSSPAQGRNDRRLLRTPAEIGPPSVERMLLHYNRDNRVSSQHKVYSWLLNQRHFGQPGITSNVNSPRSVRMSAVPSTNNQSNLPQTSPKNNQNLNFLPLLRPSKRTESYSGNRDQDPENEESRDRALRRSFASLLEVRPAKRARNIPPPPPPHPHRTPANNRSRNARPARPLQQAQPVRSSRQVLRAPAVQEDIKIDVPVNNTKDIFPLLRLPFEVREKILRHLLVSDKPVYVKRLWTEQVRSTRRSTRGRGHWGNGQSTSEHTIDTTILRTSRQMLAEGISLLYSRNQFVYLLRDPAHAAVDFASMLDEARKVSPEQSVDSGNRSRHRKHKSDTQVITGSYGLHSINIAKYGHLLRHLSIELEPNRSGQEYRELMERALDVLASFDRRGRYLLAGKVVDEKTPRIFLHTLTITISPEDDQSNRRGRRSPPKNTQEPITRCSSAIELFSSRSTVMQSLCRIDTQYLRINMHIDEGAHDEEEDEFAVNTGTGKRHLEKTIDLRFLSRYVTQLEHSGNSGLF